MTKVREAKDFRDQMVVAAVQSGMTKTAVAEKFAINRQTVYDILGRVKTDAPIIENYRVVRAEINAINQIDRQVVQKKILESITDKDIEGADLKTKAILLDKLGVDKNREYEQERLETNQSTKNVAVVLKAINALKGEDETDD